MTALKSPCINVCVMDAGRGLCKGCYRTLDEIARWSAMSDSERAQVLAVLANRKDDEARASDAAKISVPPLP